MSSPEQRAGLARAILECAKGGLRRCEFWHAVSQVLLDFSGCDALEVRLSDGELHYAWEAAQRPATEERFELTRWMRSATGQILPARRDGADLEHICRRVADRDFDADLPFFTPFGSFWTEDTWERLPAHPARGEPALCIGGHYRSLMVTRFIDDQSSAGLLLLKCEAARLFDRAQVEFYEGIAPMLGLALTDWRAERALRERVKELTCLYGIAHLIEQNGSPTAALLADIVSLIPAAWQYPELAAAQITLDRHVCASPGFRPSDYRQAADVVVGAHVRGQVEVVYLEPQPEFPVVAFLPEEDKLIAAIAREVALMVEREDARVERANLRQQLIHADRLATIGQLAAGVAHELNEPLASILGFAQLAQKTPDIPAQACRDLEKIVTASLYAREVIRKLMVFARQVPAQKQRVDLNQVVEEGLYFLEARCQKSGVELVRELSPKPVECIADPAQLKQVLVNLVVNAVQAMPQGGSLTIGTCQAESHVVLSVADTGVGMDEEVAEKIFLPFFTTKPIGEGTGLGLAVVHGIVTAHGGAVDVHSRPGAGTRITVRLPACGAEPGPGDGPA